MRRFEALFKYKNNICTKRLNDGNLLNDKETLKLRAHSLFPTDKRSINVYTYFCDFIFIHSNRCLN